LITMQDCLGIASSDKASQRLPKQWFSITSVEE
jgi:hypothetical protein